MTFIDVSFSYLTTAFHTAGEQNVNFVFIRPGIGNVETGLRFEQGGSVVCSNLYGECVGTAIKIDNAAFANGNYTFNGIKVETQGYNGRRTTILNAQSKTRGIVNITGLCTGIASVHKDYTTPLFIVGPGVSVRVAGSLIDGRKLATLSGSATREPAWITFDDCKFGWGPHPKVSITTDQYSGYELRNCTFGEGKIPNYVKDAALVTPDPPMTLTFTDIEDDRVTLHWPAVDGATYRVDQCPDNGAFSFTQVIDNLAEGTGKYIVTGLRPNTTYWFRVRSKMGSAYALGPYEKVTTEKEAAE